MRKVTENELQLLKQLELSFQQTIFSLGELEYENILLKEKIENIKINLQELKTKENNIKQELIEKYGDNISINLTTGEY